MVTAIEIYLPLGGSIAGRLLNPEGEAVANAKVNLYTENPANPENPAYRPEGPFQQRPRGELTHSTRTGRDGRFKIEGIGPGMRYLEARADGYLTYTEKGILVGEGTAVGPLDLRLERGRSIEGRAVDGQGTPLEGVRISVMRQKGSREGANGSATTDAEGNFRIDDLGAGAYNLFATKSGFVRQDLRSIAAPAQGLTVTLRRYGGLSGAVTFVGGTPPSKFEVGLRDYRENAETIGHKKAFSSRKGRFLLDDVAPGDYELVVTAEGFEPSLVAPLRVDEDQILEGIHVVVDAGGLIEGVVTDDRGDPVARADVFVRYLGEGDLRTARRVAGPARTDSGGFYSVSGLSSGRYEVMASHGSLTTAAAGMTYLRDGDRVVVNLSMVRAGSLNIRVSGTEGEPIEGAAVEVTSDQLTEFSNPKALRLAAKFGSDPKALSHALERMKRTDVTGFIQIPSIPASSVTVDVRAPDHQPVSRTVRVFPGETTELTFVLE